MKGVCLQSGRHRDVAPSQTSEVNIGTLVAVLPDVVTGSALGVVGPGSVYPGLESVYPGLESVYPGLESVYPG